MSVVSVGKFRQAEIQNLGGGFAGNHQVLWFQIAMNDANWRALWRDRRQSAAAMATALRKGIGPAAKKLRAQSRPVTSSMAI